MAIVYGANRIVSASPYKAEEQEFETLEAAKAYVEEMPLGGKVITWNTYPNLPGCLPAIRYQSCALTVRHSETNNEWKDVNIF